ncbi:hypothetical protein [Acidisoma sp. L85]|uniref:hypothetical protein n=1 Tax=Acidisoma sp. L85 TaxID=1641850 RepID=UPI00131BEB4D|nr:hypothetical protein [Acidisoma sp. L85]
MSTIKGNLAVPGGNGDFTFPIYEFAWDPGSIGGLMDPTPRDALLQLTIGDGGLYSFAQATQHRSRFDLFATLGSRGVQLIDAWLAEQPGERIFGQYPSAAFTLAFGAYYRNVR